MPATLRALAEAHLQTCAGCRHLMETIEGIQRMPVPLSLFAPDEVVAVRPMPSRAWFTAIAFALPVLVGVLAGMFKGVFGWERMPDESAVLFSVLSIFGLSALAVGFYRQFKPGAREPVDGLAALAILVAGFLAFASVEFGWHPTSTLIRGAWGCLRMGTLVALASSVLLLLWARKGYAVNPNSASFWTGALASMAGLIALGLHCPNFELSHQLFGHGIMIIVSSCLVAFGGRRIFSLR